MQSHLMDMAMEYVRDPDLCHFDKEVKRGSTKRGT